MKRILALNTTIIIALLSCIHHYQPQRICEEFNPPDGIQLRVRMKLEFKNDRVSLVENIFIKGGDIRIDVLGVFDNTLLSILTKEGNIYVIDYSSHLIYRFKNREEFVRQFNINLPVSNLPFLLTLSPKNLYDIKDKTENTYLLSNGEKITIFEDNTGCRISKVYIDSPQSGQTIASYSEFYRANGYPFFHNLKIQNHEQNIRVNIKVLKVNFGDISDSLFDIEGIKGFNYVNR